MELSPKTVLIKHEDYPEGLLINANDFDQDVHVLADLDVAIFDTSKNTIEPETEDSE